MTSLYLARHGESELNTKKVYFGVTNCELTSKGILECNNLNKKLSQLNELDFDVIITSSLKRAIDSCKIIANCSYKDLIIFEEFKELDFGKWEGLSYKEITKIYPKEWDQWLKDWKNAYPTEGENFKTFYKRVKNALEFILKEYKDKKILLVCHQGTLRVITSILLGLDEDGYWRFSFEYGMYSLFEIVDDFAILKKINC
ncbi:histidine phosphatase family protein [Clostridium massiliodielmoense]|uniref:histidine phosphatase family protein n=1 Tax=Clostridium massiliodielmoense TaxID=1776385 RepID=UPI000A26B868|nr:histidine phosphatase family protein [Clostridium massiliodielmoense]